MSEISRTYFHSPLGIVEIAASMQGLQALRFVDSASDIVLADNPHVQLCMKQLSAYFEGELTEFALTFDFQGTEFQKKVWNELLKIPYGRTRSYMDVALKLENPGAIRAVGAANGKNPLSIVVPCHRVIGSDGSLTGYAGGIHRKKWLLEFERGKTFGTQQTLF